MPMCFSNPRWNSANGLRSIAPFRATDRRRSWSSRTWSATRKRRIGPGARGSAFSTSVSEGQSMAPSSVDVRGRADGVMEIAVRGPFAGRVNALDGVQEAYVRVDVSPAGFNVLRIEALERVDGGELLADAVRDAVGQQLDQRLDGAVAQRPVRGGNRR